MIIVLLGIVSFIIEPFIESDGHIIESTFLKYALRIFDLLRHDIMYMKNY